MAEYERLVAAAHPPEETRPERRSQPAVAHAVAGAAFRRRAVILGAAALLIVVGAVTAGSKPSLPQQVPVPGLAGTTLVAYGRTLDPATGPGSITYQPEGYTVHQPSDRTVAVALRCVGEGAVRISAGARFDFRCSSRERTAVLRDTGPRTAPFLVVAATVGNVVWSARVVLLEPAQTAGAVPSFRGTCGACAVRRSFGRADAPAPVQSSDAAGRRRSSGA